MVTYPHSSDMVICLNRQQWLFQCCPSLSSQTGWTTLMSASFRGHLPIVERLLVAWAQPDLQEKVLLVQ